jgi:hypothetical protein
MAQTLSATQILQRSLQADKLSENKVKFYLALFNQLVARRVMLPIQTGNTVFFLVPKRDGTHEVHIATVEGPGKLPERMKQGFKMAKEIGVKKVTSKFRRPGLAEVIKKSGLPVQISMSQVQVGDKMMPAYQVDLVL